jgi:hypothetical protein
MKRSIEALVVMELVAVVVAMTIVVLCGVARAQPPGQVSPVVKLTGEAALTATSTTGVTPAVFHVDAAFSTDTLGAEPLTIQQAVVFFPDHAGTNGPLFPSCSAQQIERFHGNLRRCPKGSQIGSGTVTARALSLGITARGRVTLFNGPHGKSITFNIQTLNPARIDASLVAPITQLHGIYGEKLTLVVPHALQEIIPGVFVGVQDFDVTISGVTRAHGKQYSYLKARTCPRRALHGEFDFLDSTTGRTTTATADTRVRCTVR